MSYNTLEISKQDSKPISLYDFRLGSLHWRYTNGDHDIDLGDDTPYAVLSISDGGAVQGGGGNSEEFAVTISLEADVCSLFNGPPPTESLWLTVRRIHEGDDEAVVSWIGTVGSFKRSDAVSGVFSARTIGANTQRGGLRLTWERNCPHMLYGPGCYLNKDDWGFDTTIDSIVEGNDIINFLVSASSFAMPDLPGGFIEWDLGGGVLERRGIIGRDGTIWGIPVIYPVHLLGGNIGLTAGLAIRVYPGCSREIDSSNGCSGFSNTNNFGGFPQMPGKSPFDGTPVF